MKNFLKWVVIIFVALIIIGIVFGDDSPNQKSTSPEQVTSPNQKSISLEQVTSQVKEPEVSNEPSLTNSQRNAVRSAKQYLEMTGFSRDGLIQQLSSSAGDGYDVNDAKIAVDSLNNNWNEEAVKSAKLYLEMTGFSCNGLIEQLSSKAGDKYTVSQATYGAKQAGACS